MKEKVHIFFDEFGNTHLDTEKEGSFSHFVYCAFLIKESDLEKARDIRKQISTGYFQGADIKSRNIKNDDKGINKRISIIKDINQIDFILYAFVISKAELKGEGLKQKQIFLKYFQKLLILKFADQYSSFKIYADELGYPEFKRSLTEFINRHALQRDLFNPDRTYRLVDDVSDEKLIQLADFFAGCIGKIFCISHIHERASEIFDAISNRIYIDFFPYQKSYFFAGIPEDSPEKDKNVALIALELANKFMSTYRTYTPYHADEILNYLLLSFKVAPDRLVETRELVGLIKRTDSEYTENLLRLAIAYLRDNGVLIVSILGRYGYKIPNKLEDLYGFFNLYLNRVVPMLNRINASNNLLKINSVNELNIIEKEASFGLLKELINVVNKPNIA